MGLRVTMPEMGEGVTEGTVSRWLKQAGDTVRQYEPLLEIETDKVTTEATAEISGILLEIFVEEGQTVPVGTLLAYVGEPGETPAKTSEPAAEAAVGSTGSIVRQAPVRAKSTNGSAGQTTPYTGRISPVVGRIAGEHNVDLNQITGTGRDGRITKNDILAYLETRQETPPPVEIAMPAPEPSPIVTPPAAAAPVSPEGEVVPLTSMRRAIAEHMVRSKQTSPHVTTVFEFDFSAVAAHREANKAQFSRDGARLTFLAYLLHAVVQALKQHPMANSSWSEEGIIMRRDINIGIATALTDGLIVPVIKNADSMNLLGLARAINSLADRARHNRLAPSDVQGGTFTITNHGASGSLFGAPIINQPQCGILGMGKIEKRVKVINDAIAIRPLAYVSFTFDHRILDGATADAFVNSIKEIVENW